MNDFADKLLSLPRPVKRALALVVDAAVCALCVWLAFALRLDNWAFSVNSDRIIAIAVATGLALPIFIVTGFYRAIFRFSGTAALIALVQACAVFGMLYALIFTLVGIPGVPRSVGINVPLLVFVLVGASRLLARYWLGGMYQGILNRKSLPQVVIYGAGAAGRQSGSSVSQQPRNGGVRIR
ncbi:hypothetical protein [Massilia phosphatilytica]